MVHRILLLLRSIEGLPLFTIIAVGQAEGANVAGNLFAQDHLDHYHGAEAHGGQRNISHANQRYDCCYAPKHFQLNTHG